MKPFVLACALLGASHAALAQDPTPHSSPTHAAEAAANAPSKGEQKALRDFQMLDFNRDGKLSRAEVRLFPRLYAAFDEADTDHDGYISFEEVKAFAVKYRAERDRAKTAAHDKAPAGADTAPPKAASE